ncbi:MAG: prepilin-type N-terminal cleavage/methylation domain-containing protein [Patescibacteria group bacterium]|nr:prepilin-type N-terminal cleavage/methylation domain-containing protein [Patescibacteria group bacterium]
MFCLSKSSQNKKAFTLIESIISIAIFVIFAFGIYGSIQYIYKVVYSSRLQILETAILNEQMEIVRNMDFFDVGIVSSTPVGILTRNSIITRNGINFLITRSIRNIDDPADGTIDAGSDTSPNDYKLVFLEASCLDCPQTSVLSISSYVADSFPETTNNSGALFVNVKDSNNVAVQGANVHVLSNDPSISINMNDTTDNNGILKIYDLKACYRCYEITISKDGFTSDQTYSSVSLGGATPTSDNEHVTVEVGQVTNSAFQIDIPSAMTIKTLDDECQPVANVAFNIVGGGIIANIPDTYYYQNNLTSNSSGEYDLNNLHWGDYFFTLSNNNFVGSIPNLPKNIWANSSQSVSIIVAPQTTRSMSVLVTDGGLPVSDAKVTLNSGGNVYTKYTGLGYFKQDEWLGLGSNEMYETVHSYWYKSNTEYDITNLPYGLKLTSTAPNLYENSGYLESSTFDFGEDVDYRKIDWIADLPSSTTIKFQIATSNSSTPQFWQYVGYDGTSDTYYDVNHQDINSMHNGQRYLRYKVYFISDDVDPIFGYSRYTPTLAEVDIFYVKSCSLPGQVYFDTIPQSSNNTITIEANGYETQTLSNITIDSIMTTTTILNFL